jgi:hypothetical protein
MPSSLATETAASIHIGQQQGLSHLKCTRHIQAAPLGQNRNISVQVQCFSNTKHVNGHVIQIKSQSKVCVCVIETNNSPDTPFTEIDTCLNTSCLLVWLLKQQPAATSDSIQQKRLSHLKCTKVHSSHTTWSKQEQHCAGTMLFKQTHTKRKMQHAGAMFFKREENLHLAT